MGMVAGALVAAKAIDRFHPRAIAMVGICAGVKGKTQVGDIIMADPSWDYQSGKRVTEAGKSKLQLDTHQIPLQESLRAHAEQMKGNTKLWNDIRTAWVHPVSNVPRLLVGAVASGSAVVADGTLIPDLVDTQQRKLLGVEMEIYGVYAAAAYSNRPKPAVFAMKAVCDFGDEKKDDAHQAYAAYTSANALKGFVEAYFSKLFY
jgi:nucleoside phosphorylase